MPFRFYSIIGTSPRTAKATVVFTHALRLFDKTTNAQRHKEFDVGATIFLTHKRVWVAYHDSGNASVIGQVQYARQGADLRGPTREADLLDGWHLAGNDSPRSPANAATAHLHRFLARELETGVEDLLRHPDRRQQVVGSPRRQVGAVTLAERRPRHQLVAEMGVNRGAGSHVAGEGVGGLTADLLGGLAALPKRITGKRGALELREGDDPAPRTGRCLARVEGETRRRQPEGNQALAAGSRHALGDMLR